MAIHLGEVTEISNIFTLQSNLCFSATVLWTGSDTWRGRPGFPPVASDEAPVSRGRWLDFDVRIY